MSEHRPWRSLFQKRMAAGVSTLELAARTGYSVSYIGHLERGIRPPIKPARFALATALGCNPAELDDTGSDTDVDVLTLDIIAAQHAELSRAIDRLRAEITDRAAA